MLHIHNGDCSADSAGAAGIEGQHVAWREALIVGPVTSPGARERFLATEYGASPAEVARDLNRVRRLIEQETDEVVLWFGPDLFCQVNFWCVASLLESSFRRPLFLCPTHDTDRPAETFAARRSLTPQEVSEAAAAWRGYSSENPTSLQSMAASSPLGPAIQLHLSRFPSVKNGLGSVETKLLTGLRAGAQSFPQLFSDFSDHGGAFGFGDTQVWSELMRLNRAAHPLIRLATNAGEATAQLTREGESVLAGEVDAVQLNGLDLWLGGVHLQGFDAGWRWDGEKLVATS